MKLTIVIFLFHMISYGQSIYGKWELISFQDDKIYYSVQNDSLSPKDHWDKNDSMLPMVKQGFKDTNIEFTKKEHLILKSLIVGDKNSKYKVDSKTNLIILDELGINDEKIFYKYKVLNDILILNLTNDITLTFRRNI